MPPLSKSVASPRVLQVEALTAEDVVLRPLTKYCDQSKRHVQSSSFHGLWYVGGLEIWANFENEVEKNFAEIKWKDHPTILDYGPPSEDVSELHLCAGDHFICGEELSISGRWVQHALHPMSTIGKELEYKMVFGDWKATAESDVDFVQLGKYDHDSKKVLPLDENVAAGDTMKQRKRKNLIPDYALMVEGNGAPRVVGEAKTPWNHDFQALWVNIRATEEKLSMRRALVVTGQIGNYMIELQLKYGFLTNFDQTFFLKREIVNNEEILYCSPPVEYNASPLYGDKISLRQSLLLLQSSVMGNESKWRLEKTSEDGIIRKKKSETMKETKCRVERRALQGMDGVSHKFEALSVEEGQRRARFDPNPVSGPPSRSSTRKPRKR
ncbi:hypothetical protein FQN50_002793 [Emmonsiellopsis sp. PD_5]|nr:hypothetical protein FQN50_002793 [Emmonsiellopsis sp. PD_5]